MLSSDSRSGFNVVNRLARVQQRCEVLALLELSADGAGYGTITTKLGITIGGAPDPERQWTSGLHVIK